VPLTQVIVFIEKHNFFFCRKSGKCRQLEFTPLAQVPYTNKLSISKYHQAVQQHYGSSGFALPNGKEKRQKAERQ
jgi:hypothetical protein